MGRLYVGSLFGPVIYGTKIYMSTKKRAGRPKKSSHEVKGEYLDVRLDSAEKQAFKEAAELCGLSVAAWVRERLRAASRRELMDAGRTVAFLIQRGIEHG